MFSGPCQDRFIVSAGQSNILSAHRIDAGICPEQRTHDVIIEVFVRQPPQHGY